MVPGDNGKFENSISYNEDNKEVLIKNKDGVVVLLDL